MRSWENQLSWEWWSVCLCLYVQAHCVSSAGLSEDSLTHLRTPTQKHTLTQSYNQPFMTAAAHMWIRMLTLVGCCKALSTDSLSVDSRPLLTLGLLVLLYAVPSTAHCSSSSVPLLLQALRASHIFSSHWLNPCPPVRDQTHLFISIPLCPAVSITDYIWQVCA